MLVPTRRWEAFSQTYPPCIRVDAMTAGNAAAGRSSVARSTKVCEPPPLAPIRAGSHVGETGQEVEGAERVPRLDAERALEQEIGPRVAESRPVGELPRVRVAHHVVAKHNTSHARELHAARLDVVARRLGPSLGLRPLAFDGGFSDSLLWRDW